MTRKNLFYLTVIAVCLIIVASVLRANYIRKHPPGAAPRNMVQQVDVIR